MKIPVLLITVILVSTSLVQSQDQPERIIIIGDSLRGRIINNESVREVMGNVVMTHGNVRITCKRAIQFIQRNEAELIGDVVAVQDTITVITEKGYYYGNEKYTYSDTLVSLYDGHITLTADRGYYFFEEDRAEFFDNVILVDSVNNLSADELIYFNKIDKAVAVGNVHLTDQSSSVAADSLIHFRREQKSLAFENITIRDSKNNIVMFGNELTDESNINYSRLTGNPILAKIDTSNSGRIDTLMIFSKIMESFDDSLKRMVATDSVRIVRGGFYSVNNKSVYFDDEDKIFTCKKEDDITPPILWYDNSQLTGDSVNIYLKENEINYINVNGNSLVLSKVKNFENRFDQISGKIINMYFRNGELNRTDVTGNVLSIYYMFEENDPSGVLKSSSERTILYFDSSKVVDVKLYGSIKSEFHPEELIKGKEQEFTLPTFVLYKNKPDKKALKRKIKLFN